MKGIPMRTIKHSLKKKKYRIVVTVSKNVTVEFDASIMPDDEWRSHFYNSIHTPANLAEHLAYNYVANDIDKLSSLDGFADKKDSQVRFEDHGWDVDSD